MRITDEAKSHIRMVLEQHDQGLITDMELAGALVTKGAALHEVVSKLPIDDNTGMRNTPIGLADGKPA